MTGVPAEGVIISTNREDRGFNGRGSVVNLGRVHLGVKLGGRARLLSPAGTAGRHARQGTRPRRTGLRERRLASSKYFRIHQIHFNYNLTGFNN